MQLLLLGVSHRTAPDRAARAARLLRSRRRRRACRAGRQTAERARRPCCRRATGWRSTWRATTSSSARRDLEEFVSEFHGIPRDGAGAAPVQQGGDRRGPPPVPRRGRPGFAGRRRAADPRTGQGRVQPGRRAALHGPAAQQAVPRGVRRRQARPLGDGARRGRGLGRLRGGGAGAQDLRRPQGTHRAGRRRGRDGQAHGPAHAVAGNPQDAHHQPHRGARRRARGRDGRHGDAWEELGAALVEADIVITATGSARADPLAGLHRADDPRRAATGRCSSSTSPCRATSSRPPAISSRSFSTTSTTCRRSCRRTCRGGRPRPRRREALLSEEVARFGAWLDSREAIPTVVALRQRFESIRLSELRRLEPKLASLPPEARARVEEITRLLIEKLLIGPTVQLKSIRDADTVATYTEALSRLFNLTPTTPASGATIRRPPRGPTRTAGGSALRRPWIRPGTGGS